MRASEGQRSVEAANKLISATATEAVSNLPAVVVQTVVVPIEVTRSVVVTCRLNP